MGEMTPPKMHEHGAAVMTGKADGTPKHDHSAVNSNDEQTRTGRATRALQNTCATTMSRHEAHASPAVK
jgi:hypothetical protein